MPKRIFPTLSLLLLTACSSVQPLQLAQSTPVPAQNQIVPQAAVALPTPASTPQLLALAADQHTSGEYAEAAATFEQVLAQQPTPDEARMARLGLGENALLQGNNDLATQLLSGFLADGQTDALASRALFWLARAHENAGRWDAAIEHYAKYRERKTAIEPYAALRQAALERAAGRTDNAIATFEYVGQQPIARARRAEALETLIAIYGDAGRSDLQLARFRDLLAISQNPDYRPQVLWRAAQIAPGSDEARNWLRELASQFPARSEAIEAVASLHADPAGGLPPLVAANVFFLHERYADAVTQFDATLADELSERDRFEARRKRALSLRAQALYQPAMEELGALAQQRPIITISDTAQAELDYVQTVGWSGNVPWAINGYRSFAQRFPDHELAPEALWRAIQLTETLGDLDGAMQASLDLGRRYGGSTQAHIALTRAGMHFYQRNQRDAAIEAWRLLGDGAKGWDSAEGHFWAGNALVQAGNSDAASTQLQAATHAAPQSFYGMRARELLNQTSDGTIALGSGPSPDEQNQAVNWIMGWSGQSLPSGGSDVAETPEVQRARELGLLDLRNEARDEWFAARDLWNDDPLRLWHLALQANEAGTPYVALKTAERILQLSPDKQITPQTPTGLLRLIYPTPYSRVVQREAHQFGIDPRIIYALLRQESLFNPDATSWVGARGLGQVMPATGEGIAQNLGVESYHPDLLYRPAVSIRFGSHYISHQLRSFDNNLLAAASAYNGGPGNAARWLENTQDRDLFAELIDYRETRDYVKIVYGNYGMYRMLYGQ